MKELNIIVCLKQIPDPEGPISSYAVDSTAKKMKIIGLPPVINPFDENALEGALKLKDRHGAKITVISMGDKLSKPVLAKALGAGADELLLIEDDGFNELDSHSTAYILSTAIQKIENYDLIFVGRQAGDWDFGQTGTLLARMLNIPAVNLATDIQLEGHHVRVKKIKRNGYQIVNAPMPVLISADSQLGALRYPSLKALMAAKKKKPIVWDTEDLDVDSTKLERRKLYQLDPPPPRFRNCHFIEGQSPKHMGENLAVRMRQDGLF